MRFSDQFLATVRDRASIARYAERKLTFDRRKSQPAKGDYWACCPFHSEKSPSFHVLDQRGLFKCFGCGAQGDIFGLAMQLEGLSFPEAVARIADEAGVALPRDAGEDPSALARRKRLHDAVAAAQAAFVQALASPDGAAALKYLEKRGIDAAARARFGLGYAPAGPAWLAPRLRSAGFTEAELKDAGLVRGDDGRRPWDFFRDRITFPIADGQGRIVGFGGRALDPAAPAKYMNSPDTPLFSKGRLLYRLKEARETLARTKGDGLVVAEGYLDVIAFERAGIPAVAPLGTALTEDQLDLLWRSGKTPVFCFDGDAAGLRAADRALDLALPKLAPTRTLAIAVLPEGLDPDDVFRRDGAAALAPLLAQARPAVEALAQREIQREPLTTPEQRAGLKQRLRDAAGRIQDEGTRREYLRDLLARADAALAETLPRREWRPREKGQGAGGDRAGSSFGGGSFGGRQGGGGQGGGRGGFPARLAGITPELRARVQATPRPGNRPAIEQVLRGACESPEVLERGGELLASLPIADPDLDRIRDALLHLRAAGEPVDQEALSRHLAQSGEESAAACVRAWRLLRPPPAPSRAKAGPAPASPLPAAGEPGAPALTGDAGVADDADPLTLSAEETIRRQEEALWRQRLEAEWMALATSLVTQPEIEADVASLLARDDLDDDAFARAVAMRKAQRDVDRALIAAREAPGPTEPH
ncbi:MAG: DNA primase [Alphaproteobacteria bacterium]|nr:DNA primase [Alphaproteobacteria bacterium]